MRGGGEEKDVPSGRAEKRELVRCERQGARSSPRNPILDNSVPAEILRTSKLKQKEIRE